jgi:C-terminal processing protease CtpA/Prc
MKKILAAALLFILSISQLEGASNVQNLTEIEKLSATAKIWGFLKYYHPAVANGSLDWDEQLLHRLEEVEKSESKKELSKFFLKWIEELGEVPKVENKTEEMGQNFFTKNFDLSWIENGIFSQELKMKLRFIEQNRYEGEQFYVSAAEQVGSAVFINEKKYDTFTWEERNLRLLALFRYWNQVEYFFPYKYQMDKDWDRVLKDMLPLFLHPATEIEYHLTMLELVAHLDDSHAYLITPQLNKRLGFYWAPVKLQIINGKPVVIEFFDSSFAEKDDWKLGDILLKVNDVSISNILDKEKKYLTGSNLVSKYRDIHIPLLNGSTDSVKVEILRDGSRYQKTVKRYYRREFKKNKTAEKWKLINDNIGYVDLGLLEREEVDSMFEAFKDTQGIILDLRNYPRGTWYGIATHLHKNDFEISKSLIPVLNYPGKFQFTESLKIPHQNPSPYGRRVAILVDEYTQSQGEYTVMALQSAPQVVVIGRPTSGANGNVSDISFVGGYTTYMSGLGVFYPDGRGTQRVGISPDIEVEPSIEDIRMGKDVILTKALEILTEKPE